jgi:CubicO group peptidase (beta-lactamase class C family)
MSAVIFGLMDEGILKLDDPITTFFAEGMLQGLHVLKGKDSTDQITLRHLLSNTSGIPDYFSQKSPEGASVAASLMAGEDHPWGLEQTLAAARSMTPRFYPGQPGKVQYSDTNYQLMGKIVEKVTGKSMPQVFQERLIDPLQLSDTYAYQDQDDTTPRKLYYNANQIHLPRYIASITAEGGIVSTAKDCMEFLKAFFDGRFFDKKHLEAMKDWRLIFFPGQFYFGLGLEKLWIPRIASPFNPVGDVLGFWGQSGAFAFHNPRKDLYFTGTVNQLSGRGHSAAFKAMLKILKSI